MRSHGNQKVGHFAFFEAQKGEKEVKTTKKRRALPVVYKHNRSHPAILSNPHFKGREEGRAVILLSWPSLCPLAFSSMKYDTFRPCLELPSPRPMK